MELLYKWLRLKSWIFFLFAFTLYNEELLAKSIQGKDLQPNIKFDLVQIQIGSKKWKVELAKTQEQHQKGMMYREDLSENEGMLFVFEEATTLSFWMKNTLVDLSIAYIDKNKKIVDIQEMKATSPLSISEPPTYPSKKPAMYALEMPKGWFKKNKIKVGATVKILDNTK